MIATALTRLLSLETPVVQAPMAGVSDGRLAGAVSAAGALGMIGVGPSATGDWVREQHAVAAEAAGGRPFGIGLMAWVLPGAPGQLDAVLDTRPAFASVSFGDIAPYVRPLQEAGIVVGAQVGTLDEALEAERAGVDVVVARGLEAGGHGRDAVATLPLLQRVLAHVRVPVLAAGGISSARGLAAVIAAGAAGAWVGTAFIACPEAQTVDAARERLLGADETATVYGRVFDVGQRVAWPEQYGGRALRNAYFDRWVGHEDELARDDDAHQAVLAARRELDPDIAPLYAGHGVGELAAVRPAADVVRELAGAGDLLRRAADAVSD
ncbi:nitronate monooxygenase family protein [Angustibacter sp. Root456]|uniref:NAD(P)H-dependent flavin oxidoreductase n=1 Tax=Angustibacter sp. Root456 TaxID=1736539 RepID=UPI0006F8F3BC|nr:nitronate monooxygenase [Angustibacter sp. Root456]KQX65955.1 oxidoreductase [Angustibacter sp. Root456]